jgi:PilZ domain
MIQPECGPELRRWNRHKIDVRLKVSIGGAQGNVVFGRGNILSQGGMGAYIPHSMTIGTEVLLQVSFPYSPAEVTLKAVVKNCEGFRYGLEFRDLSDDVRSLIMKNCNSPTLSALDS